MSAMAEGPRAEKRPQPGGAERKYDLRYALKKRQQFSLRNMYVGNTYVKRGDSRSKTGALTRDLQLVYTVVETGADGITFEVEYRGKVYRNTGSDGKVVVTDFAPIVGKKVRYTISPSGELGGFVGFEQMPGVPMPGGWTYDGPRYREELEHMLLVLPTAPVGKGDTWTRSAFGVRFEYLLVDEVKMFGRDCVRIFAKVEDEQTRSMAKDRNGNDVQVERSEPYSDIYYFDYKNGMMLSRFSVASLGQQVVTDMKGAVLQHQVTDRLYETFVTFK
jgi:hypothetical protein